MSEQKGAYRAALAALDTGGGILSLANPEEAAIIVTRLAIYTTTKSTGACTADAGIAAGATTSSDNLIDGVDLGTAAGQFCNLKNAGTNGKASQLWAANQYLTISMASGAAAGLVGYAYVEYIRA
jgi:hypothetical protein